MKKNGMTIGLLAVLTVLAVKGALATDQVALLISPAVFGELCTEIKQYKEDVEKRFPVNLHITEGDWETPLAVRVTIERLHAEKTVSGVILVGALPMHRFFMHEHANPNPLYYEDFDLDFIDNNKDGVDEAYTGKPQLKVWVANIRACEKAREDDIPGLRRFFAKTHDYYTGKAAPELRTLLFTTGDYPVVGDEFRRNGGTRFSAPADITMLEGKACTLKVEIPNGFFGDPANGIVKQLKVDYTFEDKEKSKTVNDGETLRIDR